MNENKLEVFTNSEFGTVRMIFALFCNGDGLLSVE